MSLFIVYILNTLVIAAVVVIHYEFLYQATQILPKLKVKRRFKILIGVYAALIAHSVEVWIFGLAYYWKHLDGSWGSLEGNFRGTLFDCVYFSFTTYTTLGFGDIYASGAMRYLIGAESLVGLVLITWTASFLFLEMEKYWKT